MAGTTNSHTADVSALEKFSSLAYLADASVSCSELEVQKNNEIEKIGSGALNNEEKDQNISKNEVQSQYQLNEEIHAGNAAAQYPQNTENWNPANEEDKNNTEEKPQGDKTDTVWASSVQGTSETAKSHTETTFSGCKECLSLSLKDLAQHIISKHKGPNGFNCDFCHTVITSSVNFGKHILSHVINAGVTERGNNGNENTSEDAKNPEKEDDGTYHCNTCDKRFSSYLDLQRHLSLHKSYICAVCDKGFSRPVVFKKHTQMHTREEIRLCEAERDKLYEEIRAAAAVTKVPLVETLPDPDLSKAFEIFPLPEDEASDTKKKKRKNYTQKMDTESQQPFTNGIEVDGTEKVVLGKRSADKKSIDGTVGGKKKRLKVRKEDNDVEANRENETIQENSEGKGTLPTYFNSDANKVKNEDAIQEVSPDSKINESDSEIKINNNEAQELGKNEMANGVRENVNVLMDAVEATVNADNDTVILVMSSGSGEIDNDLNTMKEDDSVKMDQDLKGIISKENEKVRRGTNKRSNSYKCSNCPAEFKSRQEARDHERHTHNAVLPWQCEVCGEGFWSSSQFKKHSSIEHNDNVPFKCGHCGKKLSGPGILRTHLGIHTGVRPYACHICNRDFLTRTNLQDHLIKHANPRGYCCHLCPSKFNLRTDLSSHIRTVHENIRPWKCEHCDYAFPRQSALLRHMRTHTGEKPHKCEFCGKTFARVENCVEHRRIHTGERPHVCEVCGKTFKDSGNFSNHRKIHKDGYVPRRKKKTLENKQGDENEKGDLNTTPGKAALIKADKSDSTDAGKNFGVVGTGGKVVGTAFENLGTAVAALGQDGRVAFESLGSAVAALIGNGMQGSGAQVSGPEAAAPNVSSSEVEAAINSALVGNDDGQAHGVTVGTENIGLATYPSVSVHGVGVPTATLHDIVNAATMSATMVSNVPVQNETEVQEAMTHSNTFLQIGNILFSLDVDNGLKSLNQAGNMGEFLTLSLAGAQVDGEGHTVITQPHQNLTLADQDGVQHVQIGVLQDSSKSAEEEQLQIQAVVGSEAGQVEIPTDQDHIEPQDQTLLTCVVNDQGLVQHLEDAERTVEAEPSTIIVKQEGGEEEQLKETAVLTTSTNEAPEIEDMQTILPRPES